MITTYATHKNGRVTRWRGIVSLEEVRRQNDELKMGDDWEVESVSGTPTTPHTTTPEPVKHYVHPTGARLTVQGRIVQYSNTSHPLLTYKAGSGPEAEGLALRMGFKPSPCQDEPTRELYSNILRNVAEYERRKADAERGTV